MKSMDYDMVGGAGAVVGVRGTCSALGEAFAEGLLGELAPEPGVVSQRTQLGEGRSAPGWGSVKRRGRGMCVWFDIAHHKGVCGGGWGGAMAQR